MVSLETHFCGLQYSAGLLELFHGQDNGGVDGRQRKRDAGVLCDLGEYLQPEFLERTSCHCLILLTTFIMVLIVHIVVIVKVHIQDSKPPR